ncbi:MAG: CDP-alcohol phosphatidyltransferase family protein [Candidatus Binatia bacterium]
MHERTSVPAVIVATSAAFLPVAVLTLLERLIIALRRGGIEEISVVSDRPLPSFRRLSALGIGVDRIASIPEEGEFLFADGALFVAPEDVRRVIEARGRLTDGSGRSLPLEIRRNGDFGAGPSVPASAPSFVVRDSAGRNEAERVLWAGLGHSADGLVDRFFNRPVGRFLSKLLVHTSATPNQITILGTLVGLASAALLADGAHRLAVLGAIVFQLAAVIDCVDGEVARIQLKESAFGRWLDLSLDQVTHVAIFAAIAVHSFRRGLDGGTAIVLGASAVLGALLSFAAVVRGLRLAPENRNPRLAAIVDRMTNRDFSVAVILFAAFDRLEWFLWLVATVIHGFWIAVLIAQRAPSTRTVSPAR